MSAKFRIIGRATKDCELVDLPNGKQKANMTIASNKGEESLFFNIIAFDGKANLCAKYIKTGKQVSIEGDIKPRSYEKDGVKKYVTDYIAQDVEFLGGNSQSKEQDPNNIPF